MLKTVLLSFFFFTFLFLIHVDSIASHIVGGELSYEFVSYNQDKTIVNYDVTLNLYRDPKGIAYDQFADFGIFVQESSGAWKSYDVILDVPISNQEEIARDSDPCKLRSLNEERLQSASYRFSVSLEVTNTDYLITYQKCCRNFTINNILGGGEVGSVYDIVITPEAQKNANSSPSFIDLPPIFICAGYNIDVKNAAADKEGDVLVYSFCTPLHSGTDMDGPGRCGTQDPDPMLCRPPYEKVKYIEQYSAKSPLGNPLMTVDPNTGTIAGVPAFTGSYVVAVCLEEYRNGILLSRTRRDFEFNVVNCVENLTATISSDTYVFDSHVSSTDSIAYFETCNQTNIEFKNLSGDLIFIQDYEWQFYNQNNELIRLESGLQLRDYEMGFPGAGVYSGLMILNDGISCHDTAHMLINIIPEIETTIDIQFDTCIAGPITFNATSNSSQDLIWKWNVGDNNMFDQQTFNYQYKNRGDYFIELLVEDTFGCTDKIEQELSWYPHELVAPDTIRTEISICETDSTFINQNWVNQDGIYYDYIPSFWTGCDSIVEEITLTRLATQSVFINDTICFGDSRIFGNKEIELEGIYTDTVLNILGCDSINTLDLVVVENLSRINVQDKLPADYGSSIFLGSEVRGRNLILSEWYENGIIIGKGEELSYVATDNNWIFFESVNELFCVAIDSIFIETVVNREVFFPNAITPDGDGINDLFNIGASQTVLSSKISIYDRWGKLIYDGPETDDKLIKSGWDGTFNGRPVKDGIYVYTALIEYIDGERLFYKGDVTLIR